MLQDMRYKRGMLRGLRLATLYFTLLRTTFTSKSTTAEIKARAAYAHLKASTTTCNSEETLIIRKRGIITILAQEYHALVLYAYTKINAYFYNLHT